MNEMVERVARAIFASQQIPGDDPDFLKAHPWTQSACLLAAKAAIEAMREPTGATLGTVEGDAHVWQAMIDEALK